MNDSQLLILFLFLVFGDIYLFLEIRSIRRKLDKTKDDLVFMEHVIQTPEIWGACPSVMQPTASPTESPSWSWSPSPSPEITDEGEDHDNA